MLIYFEQPDINHKIMDYVERKGLNAEDLEDEATLMRMVEDLDLLQDMQSKVKEEQVGYQSLRNMTHGLSLSITKGRKFKTMMDLKRPVQFYFTLAGFGQKVKSSRYEAAENFSLLEKLTLNLKTAQLKADNH